MDDNSEIIDLAYRRKRQHEAAASSCAYQKIAKSGQAPVLKWQNGGIKIPSKRIPHEGKIK